MADERAAVARARRVVVKIGSRTLAGDAGIFDRLAASFEARSGTSFLIVSSGAIALGMKKLGYRTRPKEIARLQAAAAAGQSLLMRAYEEAFAARGLVVAQVLLTYADLADRARANNARAALGALLDARKRLGRRRRAHAGQRSTGGDGGSPHRRRARRVAERRRGFARSG
jgi:glutamate 5-kinase